jgi:hypothetical protein
LGRLRRRRGDQPGHHVLQVCDSTDPESDLAKYNDQEPVLEYFHHFQQSEK